jgi:hypothetical protein
MLNRTFAILTLSAILAGCQSADRTNAADLPSHADVGRALGVSKCAVFRRPLEKAPGQRLSVKIPIDGDQYRIDLEPYSVRAAGYQVLVVDGNGSVTARRGGPVSTLRGTIWGRPKCRVAGAMLSDGLHLAIRLENGQRCWMEPVPRSIAAKHTYAVFTDRDVLPTGGVCRTPGADQGDDGAAAGRGRLSRHDPMLIARIACDTDTEFVAAQGSPSAAEARINAVINAVNLQYESQVGIRHEISTIVIRTTSDPYTERDAQRRLCEFIREWTSNRSEIERDVTHLFTGADLRGGTIGIAADIGSTGICESDGSCSGGRFGTRGSYCLAQSDFSRSFSCVTDLTAHELGHLWGAFHCRCPNSTMNAGVTCTNSFSSGSISSILRYRDTRDCLEEEAPAIAAVN